MKSRMAASNWPRSGVRLVAGSAKPIVDGGREPPAARTISHSLFRQECRLPDTRRLVDHRNTGPSVMVAAAVHAFTVVFTRVVRNAPDGGTLRFRITIDGIAKHHRGRKRIPHPTINFLYHSLASDTMIVCSGWRTSQNTSSPR